MDLVRLSIPFDFVRPRARFSWRDIQFGLEAQLLDLRAPVDFAIDQLMNEEESDPRLVELAALNGEQDYRSYVEPLANATPEESIDKIRAKWLYLVLAWILEHKNEYPDPLGAVEEVYADFGYPESVASFVRYMPSGASDLGSQPRNEARLFENWKSFLEGCSRVYGMTL
jgi:hypothetical protein